jgi:hypothetical protein
VIDVRETQDPPCGRGWVAVDGKRADDEHPAWCSPAHCFVTEAGVRVHQQELTEHLDAASTATDPTEADTFPPVKLVAGANLDAGVAR